VHVHLAATPRSPALRRWERLGAQPGHLPGPGHHGRGRSRSQAAQAVSDLREACRLQPAGKIGQPFLLQAADLDGDWRAWEPSLVRAELADRALRIRSATRAHA
jgi:hypothetical protein